MQCSSKTRKTTKGPGKKGRKNVILATQIFNEHGRTIREMIGSLVNDESMIDDIYQNLFISLAHRPIPPNIKNIGSYLRVAIKNDVLDEVSRLKTYRIRNQRYTEMNKNRKRYDNPQKTAIVSEAMQNIYNIIKQELKPYEVEALVQKYYYDQDIIDVADGLNIKKRSLGHYLCTGMKKLKLHIHEEKTEYSVLDYIS